MFPNLADTRVNCSGMVTPDPHNWERVPGYTTPNGFHAFVFKPDSSVWYWNTDIRRMCLCRRFAAEEAREARARFNARMAGAVS